MRISYSLTSSGGKQLVVSVTIPILDMTNHSLQIYITPPSMQMTCAVM